MAENKQKKKSPPMLEDKTRFFCNMYKFNLCFNSIINIKLGKRKKYIFHNYSNIVNISFA